MADQKELEEQIRQLTQSLENLNKSSQSLGRSLESDLQRTLTSGLTKAMSNAGRKAEEEAVKQAKSLGATEDQQLEARGRARALWEGQQAQRGKMASNALLEFGNTLSKLSGQLYKGMDGLSGFAGATDSAVTSIAKLAANSNIFVKALAVAGMAVVKYGKAAVAQSDKEYKAYKELSKSGAAASDGLQGVYDMMQQFSLGVDELDKMTGLIAANSLSLAMFKGNVADGARALGKITGEIKDSGLREEFLSMGISMEEQREGAAGYLAIQTRLGRVQQQDTRALSISIGEYIKETDAITKLTGAARKEQEAARDKAMAIEQFRAHIMELENQGTVESIARSKELQKAMAELGTMKGGDQLQADLAASVTGMITKATIGGQLATGGELTRIATDTTLTSSQIVEQLGDAVRKNTGPGSAFFDLAKTSGGVQDVLGRSFGGLMDFGQASKDQAARSREVTTEQDRQRVALEAAAKAQVKGEIANLDTRAAMQGFIQMGVLPATEAMSKLAQATAWATKKLPQTAVGKPADARTTWERMTGAPPKYTGPGQGTAPGTVPGGTPKTAAVPAAAGSELGAGPVFGRPDTTRADKVQVTLEEIREELKKLVKMGGITGGAGASGQQAVQSALAEHDHAHPHGEAGAAVSPEVAAQISAGFVNPLKNMVQTSGMMRNDGKTYHGGIDLGGKIGDAIMAPITGKITRVLQAGKGDGGFGNAVEIEDAVTGMKHILAHMDKSMAKVGETVKAGTQVGTLGNTGMSTAPHLHHEIRDKSGKKIDPTQFYTGVKDTQGRAIAGAGSGIRPPQTAGRTPGGANDMTTYMRTVAMLESGGDPNARAKTSSAGGLFQFLEGSWKGLGGKNVQDRFDPAKSTEMMAKFSAQQKTQMEKNLGRGVSGADLYMGHFLGAGGATKFLGAKDRDPTQSAARLDPKAAAANKSIYYGKEGQERSVDEVYQLMTEKYRKQEANVMAGNIPALVAGITGTGTLAPGGMAGPTSVTTPVAAAPGTVGGLPPTRPVAEAPQPRPAAGQDNTFLQQLVVLNQQQNTLLGRILQTSQA